MTSHAAVVAREYEIPCVVGVKEAISNFKDGDLIKLCGNTGKYQLSTLNKITDLTLDEINNVVDLSIIQPIVDATSYDNFIDGLHFEGLVLPNLIKECLSENMYTEYKETVISKLLPHMKSLKMLSSIGIMIRVN